MDPNRFRSRLWIHQSVVGLLAVFRALSILLVLQTAGVLHDVSDVVAAFSAHHEEHEQCPLDQPCEECPVGCPNCHCSAAQRAFLPTPAIAFVQGLAFDSLPPDSAYLARVPLGPDLPAPYRPPQA